MKKSIEKNKRIKVDLVKIVEIAVIVLFVCSLIPVLYIAFFSHPLFDDYSYSYGVHNELLRDGATIASVLRIIFAQVKETYLTWQGCYSATFFATLQPGVYPVPAYWLTAFIIIGSLIISHIAFFYSVLCGAFKGRKEIAIIVSLIILGFQIQFVPYIEESFYWYNGTMAYAFFYSLMFFEWALIISICSQDGNHIVKSVIAAILAFIISGGNYTTALVNTVFLFLFLLYSIFFKKKKIVNLSLIFVISLASFCFSIFAPGNAHRAANNTSMSAIGAIWASVKYAFLRIIDWTGFAQAGLIIILVLLFYPIIKKTSYRFKFPLIAVVLGFGLFAAQATPPFYAMSSAGAQRQVNIYYYSYYLLLSLIVFYVEGWFVKRVERLSALSEVTSKRIAMISVTVSVILIIVGAGLYDVRNTTFGKTALDLKSGRAQRYDSEYKRIDKLLTESEGVVYTTDINEYPLSFYRLCLAKEDEIGYWINISMADYYGVEAIYLEE